MKKRQIQRQQAGNGGGSNRTTEDLSSLFDKELAKNQQTNYENKTSAEQTEDKNASAVDNIKELARRQDELVRKQQEFARNQSAMSPEEQKRQLDDLTREQNELREAKLACASEPGRKSSLDVDHRPGDRGLHDGADREMEDRVVLDQQNFAGLGALAFHVRHLTGDSAPRQAAKAARVLSRCLSGRRARQTCVCITA